MMQALTLLGALGMFLYGMNLMSAGLQKAAGISSQLFHIFPSFFYLQAVSKSIFPRDINHL